MRYFFFFKQKTAYEMRISDWSSDVCSSDLLGFGARDLGCAGRIAPAGVDQARFDCPDLVCQTTIALRRSRLPPERTGPVVHVAQNIVQAGKVGFGSAEFLLGIPAADVKAGAACGLFQHHASFGGLGRDDGGHFALDYGSRAMSPRGGHAYAPHHRLGPDNDT